MQPLQRHCFNGFLALTLSSISVWAWGADTAAAPNIPWPTTGWQESTPEQQGMSSDALRRLVDFGAHNDVDSLLVVRHGKLVLDTYYAPFRSDLKHIVNSATKAVVGTLTGIAIKDGLLKSVNQPVTEFFADQPMANLDANKKAIRIEHLLDLTSGIAWSEPLTSAFPETVFQMVRSPNWTSFVLDRPMAQAPGTGFNYNSGSWHLMSAILTKTTGKSAADYAAQRLFGPLGIADVTWSKDAQGISTGGFGIYMHPRDMAKLGYLYLHNGEWDGKALLPADWTDKIFHHATVDMHLDNPSTRRYANGWWTIPGRDAIMAVGLRNQLIVVLPKLDMVAVLTGKTYYPVPSMIDLLEASVVSSRALPVNAQANTELSHSVRDAAKNKAIAVPPTPALAGQISGRSYRFERNAQGINTAMLDLASASPHYEIVFNSANPMNGPMHRTGPVGLDGLFRTNDESAGPARAVRASWTDATTLAMESRALSDGVIARYTFHFADSAVDVEYSDSAGNKAQLHGVSTP